MEFKALYYEERLTTVNPHGDVGVVTLWTRKEAVLSVLTDAGVDLGPSSSRVAVIANLYGNGLPHMLRNLLHNPQIQHIIVCGKNLSGSREWLINFFDQGLEEVSFLGNKVFQIVGTNRVIDGEVRPEHFAQKLNFKVFGDISADETKEGIKSLLGSLTPISSELLSRVEPPVIPEPVVARFPSHPATHLIQRETPIEAWRELVFRLYRFGHRNTIRKSSGHEERIELLNMHVVVDKPQEETAEALAKVGFILDKFKGYQERILDPALPGDAKLVKKGYAYGWLLRTGMEETPVDSLEIIAERMKEDQESRHCYATLWNNFRHLPSGEGCPCFVTAFFRKFDGKLTFTATFRAHNAMDAWLENFYGLMAIHRFVAERAGMEMGPLTVISHSISLDPSALERANLIAKDRMSDDDVDPNTGKHELRLDEYGAFTVTFDRNTWELIVEHSYQGQKLGEYRGRTPEQIEVQLMRDLAISLPSHALYLGREMARKEQEMKVEKGKES